MSTKKNNRKVKQTFYHNNGQKIVIQFFKFIFLCSLCFSFIHIIEQFTIVELKQRHFFNEIKVAKNIVRKIVVEKDKCNPFIEKFNAIYYKSDEKILKSAYLSQIRQDIEIKDYKKKDYIDYYEIKIENMDEKTRNTAKKYNILQLSDWISYPLEVLPKSQGKRSINEKIDHFFYTQELIYFDSIEKSILEEISRENNEGFISTRLNSIYFHNIVRWKDPNYTSKSQKAFLEIQISKREPIYFETQITSREFLYYFYIKILNSHYKNLSKSFDKEKKKI